MSMQKLFAAVGIVAVLVVLGGAGWRAFAPVLPLVPQGGGTGLAKSISELSINRHFSIFLGGVGSLNNIGTAMPFQSTMPLNAGIAISQLTSTGVNTSLGNAIDPAVIRCDGVEVWRGRLANGSGATFTPAEISPPIVVRPGVLLEIFLDTPATSMGHFLTITGYTLTAADFGM